MSHGLRGQVNRLAERVGSVYNQLFPHRSGEKIVVFNTAMGTQNLGDYIIMRYCSEALRELFPQETFTHVSTHRVPGEAEEKAVRDSRLRLVCGTNLLTSHIEENWNWRLPDGLRAKFPYRDCVLLGVGWGQYQDKCSDYSRMIYRWMLSSRMLHSVRDSYTEAKLKEMGMENVINTGCPTMWRLTPEFCAEIPVKKASAVVTTITDYRRNVRRDSAMLQILGRQYERVYLWPQGQKDLEYLQELDKPEQLEILPASLEGYEACLQKGEIDYVGTRLHAGIFALNHQVRSIILAVDNRAIEIGKDTGLPVILRKELDDVLEQRITEAWPTRIRIPQENIRRFKEQFTHQKG